MAPESVRLFGPDDTLPDPAFELIETTLEQARTLSFEDYRYLVERALPEFAAQSEPRRAVTLRILTELRKRLAHVDLGGKSLSSMEYLTDGGRAADGGPEGGIYRVLDRVPLLHEVQGTGERTGGCYGRLTLDTRDDLAPPNDPARDVLVIDFADFKGESFRLDSASRILSAAVGMG